VEGGRGDRAALYIEEVLGSLWQTRKEHFQIVGKSNQVWVIPGVLQCSQVVDDLFNQLFISCLLHLLLFVVQKHTSKKRLALAVTMNKIKPSPYGLSPLGHLHFQRLSGTCMTLTKFK
jgi:hypothetical protein